MYTLVSRAWSLLFFRQTLNMNVIFSMLLLLISRGVFAQSVIAEVTGEFPYAYAQPDFDSPVVANLKPGTFYYVSKQQFAYGFHKVQLQKNQAAYISSSEIKIVTAEYVQQKRKHKNNPKAAEQEAKEAKAEEKKAVQNSKSISQSRYRGLIIEQQNYTEDTMSKTRTEAVTFFGYRVVGNNTLFSGEMSTDAAVLVSMGAPKYYQEITGNSAAGWIINTHFTFDTLVPLSHAAVYSYGFGPMAKYSHFETNLKSSVGSGTTSYVLDDLTLGVLLRLGLGVKWNSISLRSDIKYFIESKQYMAINISTLFVF